MQQNQEQFDHVAGGERDGAVASQSTGDSGKQQAAPVTSRRDVLIEATKLVYPLIREVNERIAKEEEDDKFLDGMAYGIACFHHALIKLIEADDALTKAGGA